MQNIKIINTSMKYLFYLSKAYSISIISPLVEYLTKTNREFAFFVSAKVKDAFPQNWDKKRILYNIKTAKKYNPDFVLVPGNFVDFRIPGIKVQVFHGLGVEKKVHYKIRHFFDVFLTSGPFVTDKFLKLQQKYKYFEVIETGWLKIDYILNYSTKGLKEKYNIPSSKKIILYAPTFSSKMESATELLSSIPKIINDNEFWILKFHELMSNEVIESFNNIDKKKVRIITNEDITPYLHLSDLLVSDTSSVVYEFLALDKPVITFKTIGREKKAFNIVNVNDFRKAIDDCILYPEFLKNRRDIAIQEVNPYLDGNIAKRIVTKLEEMGIDKFPKKSKPLNVFRKCQIIYHSVLKKGYLR